MLRSLYAYKSTHAKTLGFVADEQFIEIGLSRDPNWRLVVNNKGLAGFVPKNYVTEEQVDELYIKDFIDGCIEALQFNLSNSDGNANDDNKESLQKLMKLRKSKFSNKRQAPLPPKEFDDPKPMNSIMTRDASIIEGDDLKHSTAIECSLTSDGISKSLIPKIPHSYFKSIVEDIRKETDINFTTSNKVVKLVLESIGATFPDLYPLMDTIIECKEVPEARNAPKWCGSHDGQHLVEVLDKIRSCKEDQQQRSWSLYEDQPMIIQLLSDTLNILNNADVAICNEVLALEDFQALFMLVQYYQMEARWQIRKVLVKIFAVTCSMSSRNVEYLSSSVLLAELTRDMLSSSDNLETLTYSSMLFGMLLSTGEVLPYTHFELINQKFIMYLFDGIEKYGTADETLSDSYMSIVLGINLQYCESSNAKLENLIQKCLSSRSDLKYFTEKILLLFNREEDPLNMFEHSYHELNSVLKMMVDIYSQLETAAIFYTNDEKVVCDIILRQLTDLSPSDKRVTQYLYLLGGVLERGQWVQHKHRWEELKSCCSVLYTDKDRLTRDQSSYLRGLLAKHMSLCP